MKTSSLGVIALQFNLLNKTLISVFSELVQNLDDTDDCSRAGNEEGVQLCLTTRARLVQEVKDLSAEHVALIEETTRTLGTDHARTRCK